MSFALIGLLSVNAFALEIQSKAHVLFHPKTGAVISSNNPDQQLPPASLAKMMTLYVLFDAIEEGSLSLDTELPVSEAAWRKGGSKMFVEVGKQVKVSDLIQGIAVSSGNDACIVVAEYLAGSEEEFAKLMNLKAKEIGLENTVFANASGWPHPDQLTTAHDMAKLGAALVQRFPGHAEVFAQTSFTFSGIRQPNRNGLLRRGVGVDGLKTGHTEEAGYHLVSTAERKGERLFSAVLGTSSSNAREDQSLKLLNYGFNAFSAKRVLKRGQEVAEADVLYGAPITLKIIANEDLVAYVARTDNHGLRPQYTFNQLEAPIRTGEVVGQASIFINNTDHKIDLVAGHDVMRKNWFGRQLENIQLWTAPKK
jgi:D-alanyl-D-alanine carboxypeptidase (penicillin-binding protein 5/6)